MTINGILYIWEKNLLQKCPCIFLQPISLKAKEPADLNLHRKRPSYFTLLRGEFIFCLKTKVEIEPCSPLLIYYLTRMILPRVFATKRQELIGFQQRTTQLMAAKICSTLEMPILLMEQDIDANIGDAPFPVKKSTCSYLKFCPKLTFTLAEICCYEESQKLSKPILLLSPLNFSIEIVIICGRRKCEYQIEKQQLSRSSVFFFLLKHSTRGTLHIVR